MRISDWSSDVCSSDLAHLADEAEDRAVVRQEVAQRPAGQVAGRGIEELLGGLVHEGKAVGLVDHEERHGQSRQDRRLVRRAAGEIGRAACRESAWTYG